MMTTIMATAMPVPQDLAAYISLESAGLNPLSRKWSYKTQSLAKLFLMITSMDA